MSSSTLKSRDERPTQDLSEVAIFVTMPNSQFRFFLTAIAADLKIFFCQEGLIVTAQSPYRKDSNLTPLRAGRDQ